MGRHAVVLGGGIAGLSAAIALDGAGYSVELIERATSLSAEGTALSMWPNAMAALARLGVAAQLADVAAPIASIALRDADGRAIMSPMPAGLSFLPTRAALRSCLVDGLRENTTLRLGRSWRDVWEDSGRVSVRLDDDSVLSADLVVDATGIRSRLGDRLIGNAAAYRGYHGVLALTDGGMGDSDRSATEYWGERERFGVFDVGAGSRYWFYMCDAPEGEPPPDHAACAARAVGWPDVIGEAIANTRADRLVPVPIYAKTPPRRLGAGRIICIGDAAHAMEPNLGQGACLSIEDAVVLGAHAQRFPPDELLAALERDRLPRLRAVMGQARAAGRMIHRPRGIDRLARRLLPLVPDVINRRQVAAVHRFPAEAGGAR